MSSHQASIYEFPDDEDLWVVKWIDEFHQTHLLSRTAFVTVLLQKLQITSLGALARLSQADCMSLVGKPPEGKAQDFVQIYQAVGLLPSLTIGDVFQRKQRVGQLPYRMMSYAVLPGQSDDEEYRLKDELKKPPGWPEKWPYRVLNNSEYAGLAFRHPDTSSSPLNARCVVFRKRDGRHQNLFIIPRMTIFKAFYAPHTDMARAFSTGPWQRNLEHVICTADIESGQKTEVTHDGAQWNIVLRPRIDDDYCWLLAVLFFDPHGRTCANMIHTVSMQDRHNRANCKTIFLNWPASRERDFPSHFRDAGRILVGYGGGIMVNLI
ncbi:hypothetical protein F2P44_33265, partial [Massilia sp. CCM 8695]